MSSSAGTGCREGGGVEGGGGVGLRGMGEGGEEIPKKGGTPEVHSQHGS